jgi:hypothetical protein
VRAFLAGSRRDAAWRKLVHIRPVSSADASKEFTDGEYVMIKYSCEWVIDAVGYDSTGSTRLFPVF